MANVINATSTGNGGLITTGDDSGVLNIQTNETTAVTVDASQNVSFTNGANLPNTFGFKNRLINGGMVIDQRGSASTPVSNAAGSPSYFVDRWQIWGTVASKFTGQQSSTVPASTTYTKSALVTSSAATTPGAGDAYGVRQCIEGFNTADFGFGTANAQPVTISFWVRSSIAGTYSFALWNSANNPVYIATYTINAVNTWEQKSITISGSTTGTWLTDNGIGFQCWWDLGSGSNFYGTAGTWNGSLLVRTSGSVNWIGTSGATFYLTGVQVEKGTQATSFDFRSYGTELELCKRYFQLGGGLGACYQGGATATFTFQGKLAPQMRAAPSAAIQNGTSAVVQNGRAYANINSISLVINSTPQSVYMTIVSGDTGMTANYSGEVSGQAIAFSSEL